MRMRICDFAAAVLRFTDNPAVMWGDEGLLHRIAEAAGLPHEGPRTSRRVLSALSKTPGELVKMYTKLRGHWVLIFYLPEKCKQQPTEVER